MSEEDLENNKKSCDCDDPCDDCTELNMSNLTGWIAPSKKKTNSDVDKK